MIYSVEELPPPPTSVGSSSWQSSCHSPHQPGLGKNWAHYEGKVSNIQWCGSQYRSPKVPQYSHFASGNVHFLESSPKRVQIKWFWSGTQPSPSKLLRNIFEVFPQRVPGNSRPASWCLHLCWKEGGREGGGRWEGHCNNHQHQIIIRVQLMAATTLR